MPPQPRPRFSTHFSEALPAMTLVGSAVGLGLLPALLIRLPIKSIGLFGSVAVEVLLSAVAGGAAAGATLVAQRLGVVARRFIGQHRRSVRIAGKAMAADAVLLAISGAVAAGWSGEPAGAAATVVAMAVFACTVGTGSALLSIGWVLVRARRPAVMRPVAVVLSLYLSVGCFLLLERLPPGRTLMMVALALSFLWVAIMRSTPAGFGAILGFFLLMMVAVWHQDGPGSAVVRALVQIVIAVVLGTATVRLVRRSTGRCPRLRRFVGAMAIVPLAYVLFLLFDDQLLGGPLEAPVFALMVWLTVRLWRWMQEHDRALVSAAADIVFALLLGAVLVLLLVWLANLLDLPLTEVKALRGAAADLGDLIDLPWWIWASADILLTAVFLTVVLGSGRLRRVNEALGRIRVPGVVGVVRRTLSVLRIGLLLLVFLGLAAPPTVGPVLSRRIQARYTVALRKDLTARGETAFYQAVIGRFAHSRQALPVLTQMLVEVYDSAPHSSDQGGPTPTALDLAHRMGELQARTVLPFQPPSEEDPTRQPSQPPTATAVRAAGMDGNAADSADLDTRLTRQRDEDDHAETHEHEAEQAAEHAAAAVTGALGLVTFGHGVVVGLVREYLDGLAESGLSNVFLSWTDRARSGADPAEPPTAVRVVEPDPLALRTAADFQLTEELVSSGIEPGSDPAQSRADHRSPIAAAVALADHTRGLQSGTVQCTGCSHFPEPGGGEHGEEDIGGIHGE